MQPSTKLTPLAGGLKAASTPLAVHIGMSSKNTDTSLAADCGSVMHASQKKAVCVGVPAVGLSGSTPLLGDTLWKSSFQFIVHGCPIAQWCSCANMPGNTGLQILGSLCQSPRPLATLTATYAECKSHVLVLHANGCM
jgi:hypothetical protein